MDLHDNVLSQFSLFAILFNRLFRLSFCHDFYTEKST